MAPLGFRGVQLFLVGVGCAPIVIGTGSVYWYSGPGYHFGLWTSCQGGSCSSIDSSCSWIMLSDGKCNNFNLTRTAALISCIFFVPAVLLALLGLVFRDARKKGFALMAELGCLVVSAYMGLLAAVSFQDLVALTGDASASGIDYSWKILNAGWVFTAVACVLLLVHFVNSFSTFNLLPKVDPKAIYAAVPLVGDSKAASSSAPSPVAIPVSST